jgi:hypothetical protein
VDDGDECNHELGIILNVDLPGSEHRLGSTDNLRQGPSDRDHAAEGGFELRYHIDNKQLIDFAPGTKAQMPHNPASIIRLYVYLYGERTEEKTAPKCFLFNPADNSLTSALPSVKATDSEDSEASEVVG